MQDYFGSDEFQSPEQPQYVPPTFVDASEFTTVQSTFNSQSQKFEYSAVSMPQEGRGFGQNEENQFNDFEEDETAKRIREEEERIQNLLREKSERQWQEKQSRKAEGRRQLEEFLEKKEKEKRERAEQNIRKEAISKQELGKLNVEAGWRKVIMNINVRQGEHKGKKDINRMREAILHRREDDKR